jgi:hypothetical protein
MGLQNPGATTSPQYFPTDFDQTHNLIVIANWTFRNWQLGGRFRVVTGSPSTPTMEGVFDSDMGRYVCQQGPTNSVRKPTFHELDVRIERRWTFKFWQFGVYADVWNIYNAENPEGTIYDYRCRGSIPIRGIPFLPILGIRGMF